MADDWKPGDLALCVNDAPSVNGIGRLLRKGAIYTVERVSWYPDDIWADDYSLYLSDAASPWPGWAASRFKRIAPLTPEEADQFTQELLTTTPGRERVNG